MNETARTRNRRGEGDLLRGEILDAAADLLEETGDESALTLRAVARRVGITAPSIYAHFGDRNEILEGVLEAAFETLLGRLHAAIDTREHPVERLRDGCRAYIDFAGDQPQRYRVLFGLRGVTMAPTSTDEMIGAEAFALLVNAVNACVEAGLSTSPSPVDSAVELWISMHGFVTLRLSAPGFPWPEVDTLLDSLISRLALISGSDAPGSAQP